MKKKQQLIFNLRKKRFKVDRLKNSSKNEIVSQSRAHSKAIKFKSFLFFII